MYSLPTLSFPVSEDEEEEDEQVPDEIPCLQGNVSRRSQKQKYQEECPEKGIHLQRLAQDVVIVLQVHTSTGATPLLPSVYNMVVVEVPVDRSSAEIQA